MQNKRNKPLVLNRVEIQMIKTALDNWNPDFPNFKEEKAALLNALRALEYIDEKDRLDG